MLSWLKAHECSKPMRETYLSQKLKEIPLLPSNPLLLAFPKILTLPSCGLGPHSDVAKKKIASKLGLGLEVLNHVGLVGLVPTKAFVRLWVSMLTLFD